MAEVVSKVVYPINNGFRAKVTLSDGRTGESQDGGFFRGRAHDALTKATQIANSKTPPGSRKQK